MKLQAILLGALLMVLSAEASAATSIRCINDSVTVNGASFAPAKAKTFAKNKVAKASEKVVSLVRKGTKGAKLKSAKAALSLAKSNRSFIQSCLKGEKPLIEPFASMVGSYSGTWSNTTFVTSGNILAVFAKSGTLFTGHIVITGALFGSITANPIDFQTDVMNPSFPHRLTIDGTSIGTLTVDIAENGTLTIENTLIPVFNLFRATAVIGKPAASFTGTFQSYAVGDVPFAQGTITMAGD